MVSTSIVLHLLAMSSPFIHRLPESRLGQSHDSLDAFRAATVDFPTPTSTKEYTLIVVTNTHAKRILLGHKHRGFGAGFYNSFGGKLEAGETIPQSAQRELHEETGIQLPLAYMEDSRVGTLYFTFQDSAVEMVVHVFRVHVTTDASHEIDATSSSLKPKHYFVDPSCIRGCDEITPQWFDDWHIMPLHTMFADDSVWLVQLLSSDVDLALDGWFHFQGGGTETNTILQYHVHARPKLDEPNNPTKC